MKTMNIVLLLVASMAFVLMGCSDESSPVVSPTNQEPAFSHQLVEPGHIAANSSDKSRHIASGDATGGPLGFPTTQAASVSLEFSLKVNKDGSTQGHAKLSSEAGWVQLDLTSYMIGVDGRVSAAGPVTKVHGSPSFGPDAEGPTPHIVQVGEYVFFSVLDNGDGAQSFIEGKVPSFLPPFLIAYLTTIQAILGPPGPGPAPAFIFRQVLRGHFEIH